VLACQPGIPAMKHTILVRSSVFGPSHATCATSCAECMLPDRASRPDWHQAPLPQNREEVIQLTFDPCRASSDAGGLKRSNGACSQNDLNTGER